MLTLINTITVLLLVFATVLCIVYLAMNMEKRELKILSITPNSSEDNTWYVNLDPSSVEAMKNRYSENDENELFIGNNPKSFLIKAYDLNTKVVIYSQVPPVVDESRKAYRFDPVSRETTRNNIKIAMIVLFSLGGVGIIASIVEYIKDNKDNKDNKDIENHTHRSLIASSYYYD